MILAYRLFESLPHEVVFQIVAQHPVICRGAFDYRQDGYRVSSTYRPGLRIGPVGLETVFLRGVGTAHDLVEARVFLPHAVVVDDLFDDVSTVLLFCVPVLRAHIIRRGGFP